MVFLTNSRVSLWEALCWSSCSIWDQGWMGAPWAVSPSLPGRGALGAGAVLGCLWCPRAPRPVTAAPCTLLAVPQGFQTCAQGAAQAWESCAMSREWHLWEHRGAPSTVLERDRAAPAFLQVLQPHAGAHCAELQPWRWRGTSQGAQERSGWQVGLRAPEESWGQAQGLPGAGLLAQSGVTSPRWGRKVRLPAGGCRG